MSATLIERDRSQTAVSPASGVRASRYEETFARSVGASHAVAFGYARHALIGVLEAFGAGEGDEVILSPLTCKVVPLALLSMKLKPVYADIAADTLNLDPRSVESAIKPATRAILFQHTYGNLAGAEGVSGIAARNRLPLIEDCAQCLPHAGNGYHPGRWGNAAIFSNNLLKPLPAGSGGLAVTNDGAMARKIQSLRDAMPPQGVFTRLGLRAEKLAHAILLRPEWYWPIFNLHRRFNSAYRARPVELEIDDEIRRLARRPSEYQMRAGLRSSARLETLVAHLRHCCAEYAKALCERSSPDFDLIPAVKNEVAQPLYYFPILARNKPGLLRAAQSRHVELVAWPLSAPIYPLERTNDLRNYGYEPGVCPVAEAIAERLVGLPTHSRMTDAERRRVIELLVSD